MLACAAGCTQTFGLDSARDDDRDGDHIPDGSDNCPDVANHDQSRHDLSDPRGDACRVCTSDDPTDSDGDGIPDKCDGCDNRLPDTNHNGIPDACENPHDEDGDGVPDLVDNCPSVANPDQADTKELAAAGGPSMPPDGVGDACDDTAGHDTQLFDSFAERNQLWLITAGAWQDGNDHAIVDLAAGPGARLAGLGLPTFTASTALTITGAVNAGLVATDPGAAQASIHCGLAQQGGGLSVTLSVTMAGGGVAETPVKVTPMSPNVLTMKVAPSPILGQTSVTCGANGIELPPLSFIDADGVWEPGLIAAGTSGTTSTGSAQFEYYDLVTTAP